MLKIVDKLTYDVLKPGSFYNNNRISQIFIESETEEVYIKYQGGDIHNIKDSVYVLPEIKPGLFKYDYIVDDKYNVELVDSTNCNFNYTDSSRIIGNKLFNPELNLIYNSTKKYLYDKVQLKDSVIIDEYDIKFIAVFGNEKVYLYLYYEFFSKQHVKPIATLNKFNIDLFNSKQIPSRGILTEFDKPKDFINSKKKAVTFELIHEIYPNLPMILFEINISPQLLMNKLHEYKGYFEIHVVDPNLKLKSKLENSSNRLMLIKTKFPQIIESFDFTAVEFTISEQIKKD